MQGNWRINTQEEPDALVVFEQRLKTRATRTHDTTQHRELSNLETDKSEPGE